MGYYNSSKLLLNVPYAEKDEAKRLGAKWNPELKKWYVSEKTDYYKFKKWISANDFFYVISDYLYIVEGIHTCFKCKKPTRVIGFGIENYFQFFNPEDYKNEDKKGYYYTSGEVNIVSHLNPIPDKLLKYIQEHYNYKMRYSKMAQGSYIANCCDNCDILQGDFYLFEEVDSPFFIEDESSASKLHLYRIPLKYDLVFDELDIGWCSTDYLIKKHAKITDLNIDIY